MSDACILARRDEFVKIAGPRDALSPRRSSSGGRLCIESDVRRLLIAVTAAIIGMAVIAFIVLRPSSSDSPEARPAASAALPAPAAPPAVSPAPPPAAPTARAPAAAPRRPATGPAPEAAPEEAPAAPAAPTRGTLTINADVPGAQVFIDRRFVGNAPATIDDLEPGEHRLNVSADGFEGIARTIDVAAGAREMTVRFREVRLDAALPIVHKHRIGSCTGRLVASPGGIRYETADKNDAFSAALSDIETFEVNYQERNLRIKLRKGRDYNFTDPERDADRLFVFHRDVERARGLLAKGYQPATD